MQGLLLSAPMHFNLLFVPFSHAIVKPFVASAFTLCIQLQFIVQMNKNFGHCVGKQRAMLDAGYIYED
jgi:hypothetical protein